jgi:hypothetical protein
LWKFIATLSLLLLQSLLRSDVMESVVPQEITTELTQILSNLLLGDNEIRSKCVHLELYKEVY